MGIRAAPLLAAVRPPSQSGGTRELVAGSKSMARCPSCGSDLAQKDRACSRCGAQVVWTSLVTEDAGEQLSPVGEGHSSNVEASRDLRKSQFLPGEMLADRYRVVSLLGAGGMGEVYRADDLKLGQAVALKILPSPKKGDTDRQEALINEVRQAVRVTHPNVCRVYDLGEVEGQPYLSMEYVDGEDLASLLRRIGRLPPRKAVEIARQICAGLAAAHNEGVLHRDLKPANVMVDGRGRAKITDFGLAGATRGIRGAEALAGTPAYMAPEQLAGEDLSIRTDLYALGLVLYEMFTGRRAFDAADTAERSRLQYESRPTTPSDYVASLDPAVDEVILQCLEPDPAERPESASSVAAALPGGDPLTLVLAAGETPSPELVAAAANTEAMSPRLAAALALGSILVFAVATTLIGRIELRAHVPMTKSPEVLTDSARQAIRKLGYTEPIYADPTDDAAGYRTRTEALDWLWRHDRPADRWARLRQPRQSAVSFWHRQSPVVFWPHPEWGSISTPPVGLFNPSPWRTGEITVVLDLEGRLTSFSLHQQRFEPSAAAAGEPDWRPLFELAEIEPSELTPAEPGYQGIVPTDRRAAWVGRLPEVPNVDVRIETGSYRGRPVLFEIFWPWDLELLAAAPERRASVGFGRLLSLALIMLFFFASVIMARKNLLRGRADRRGALRLVTTVFGLVLLFELLRTHTSLYGHPALPIFAISSALFWCVFVGATYLALEPHARRIWPSMLVSWSRLLSGPVVRWRDAVVGRSVLAGLFAGTLLALNRPLRHHLESLLAGEPGPPGFGSWRTLLGQRPALAEMMWAAFAAIMGSCFVVLLLVVARFLVKRPLPAAMLAVAILVLLNPPSGPAGIAIEILRGAGGVAVVLRFGLLALAATTLPWQLGQVAGTVEWTAWHAQPAVIALILIAAVAAYGYWAATAGHRPRRFDA